MSLDMNALRVDTIKLELGYAGMIYPWYVSSKIGDTRNIFNTYIDVMAVNKLSAIPKMFRLKALTFQPTPHPKVFCEYREQLLDALTTLLKTILKDETVFVVNVSPIEGDFSHDYKNP